MAKRRSSPQRRAEPALDREFYLKRYENERRRNPLAAPGPLPLVMVLDRLKAGFNVAKIFRSALAFGVREIHLIDIGPFNPAPAKGAFRKLPARFHCAFDAAAYPDLRRLAIPQSGPVQSLNVAVAASIAMYEYQCRREPRAR